MIDALRTFSKKIIWLRPLFFITAALAIVVFGYVVFFETGAEKEILIIPCVVGVLWSLVCLFLISTFPYVPAKATTAERFYQRLKTKLTRTFYYLVSCLFIALSAIALFLTVRLFNVWRGDF